MAYINSDEEDRMRRGLLWDDSNKTRPLSTLSCNVLW